MENRDIERCKAINIFFPIFIIAYVGLSLLFAIIVQKNGIQLPIWSQYVISQAFVLVPAILYVVIFKEHFPKEISYKPLKPLDVLLSLLTGYALIPMVLFIANVSMLFAKNYLNESTTELTQFPFLLQLLIIAVIPPLVEEFVFRGLFYHTYRKMGIFAGALASGLIFGLFHLNMNQFCYAAIMGFVFAYMVEATGSMWSSILAHFAVNTYSIGMLALSKQLAKVTNQANLEVQLASADTSMADLVNSPIVLMIQFVFLACFAIGFMSLAVIMIRAMAKRNGRLDRMRIFGKKNSHGGFKKILTWPAIITALFCVIYMIFIELN